MLIKVNADYESVLFFNKPLPAVNEALEFLAFYLEKGPFLTHKKYSEEFLSHVERLTGRRPVFKREGTYENWWGQLKNLELERKLNSKEMSTELNIKEGWNEDAYILSSLSDLPELKGKTYLAKSPYGMSGQNFSIVKDGDLGRLESMLKSGKVILEPFRDRVYDFSHYVFPDGRAICYENIVDKYFQYKGTALGELSFRDKVSAHEWEKFEQALQKIIQFYHYPELNSGFSVDSFVYREHGELKIQFLSEVNYRKTMGYVALKLKEKFAPDASRAVFSLATEEQEGSRNSIVLSPENSRFKMRFSF